MKFLVIAAFTAVLLGACGESTQQQPPVKDTATSATDTPKAYIPVADYIRSEIKSLDSLPVGILKRVTTGNRSDSGFIQPAEFRQLAAQFLSPELERGKFEQSFTETSFFDETTQLLTFTYEATDPALTVRRVDVLISPSLALDKIRSVYVEKAYKSGDTAVSSKMYWKGGASFQIASAKTPGQQVPVEQQVKVIWDPMSY